MIGRLAFEFAWNRQREYRWRRRAAAVASAIATTLLLVGFSTIALLQREHAGELGRAPQGAHTPSSSDLFLTETLDVVEGRQFPVTWLYPATAGQSILPPGLSRPLDAGQAAVSPALNRIIDRNPTPKVIGVCLLIAGVWAGFIALAGRAIVDQIQEWTFDFGGLRLGIFLSTLVLITLPPLVIGVITPAAIRLTVPRVGHAGTSAGTIYALGTLGSLLGTFVPVIVLIPRIGVRNTFLTMAVLGIASGALGLTGAVQQDATDPLAVDASAPVQVRDAEVEGAHR